MDLDRKIYVAGHRGMVGSAIVRVLKSQGHTNFIFRTHAELDLTNQLDVDLFFEKENPDIVYMAAAKVGGIHANNTYPADFIYENLMVECNVINSAFKNGVKNLLFLGSSCIYPRLAPQPMDEGALLAGSLEPTNEPYAVAKIAGIKLCESYNRQYGISHGVDYRSIMPTNLYGPGDNYHPENSHVIPAMINRFHHAKINNNPVVKIWGTGLPKREFLFVDDMARACVHLMDLDKTIFERNTTPMQSHVNVGIGYDITIKELAYTIAKVINYQGKIEFDDSKPDGSPRKLLNSNKINSMGWSPTMELEPGLIQTYKDYIAR